MHHDGRIALFPMYSALRGAESDGTHHCELRNTLSRHRGNRLLIFEEKGCWLEKAQAVGAPSLNRNCVLRSQIAPSEGYPPFAEDFSYHPVTSSHHHWLRRAANYQTNVMMCIGTAFALVCFGR